MRKIHAAGGYDKPSWAPSCVLVVRKHRISSVMPKERLQTIASDTTKVLKAHIKDKPGTCPQPNVTQSLTFNDPCQTTYLVLHACGASFYVCDEVGQSGSLPSQSITNWSEGQSKMEFVPEPMFNDIKRHLVTRWSSNGWRNIVHVQLMISCSYDVESVINLVF